MRRLTRKKLHPIRKDERGAAAVEFAIVASTFFLIIMGLIEFGLIQLTKVALSSATIQAARSTSVGATTPGCNDRVCELRAKVIDKTSAFINPQSIVVTATVVSNQTTPTPRVPDICLDNPENPYTASCSNWVENGGNPNSYDPPPELSPTSVGKSGDFVEIRVSYLWRVLFPIMNSYFGNNGVLTLTSSTVIKNELIIGQ